GESLGGVDNDVGVALDEIAADQQHQVLDAGTPPGVRAEGAGGIPAPDLGDVEEVRIVSTDAHAPAGVVPTARVPELLEDRAALIGRVAVPKELAVDLVVEAHHERLDEPLVGLEQADRV